MYIIVNCLLFLNACSDAILLIQKVLLLNLMFNSEKKVSKFINIYLKTGTTNQLSIKKLFV